MKDSLFSTSTGRATRLRFAATITLTATMLALIPLVSGAQQDGGTATSAVREAPGRKAPTVRETAAQKIMAPGRASTSPQEREQMKEERAGEREAKREEKKEQMRENARKRIGAHIERMVKRFRGALERLAGMADRLTSRLDKMQERGVDTSHARTLLAQARVAIVAAEESLNVLPSRVEALLQGDGTPKDILTAIESAVKPVKESVFNAHKALVEALKAAKANVRTGTATTTP